MTRWKRRFNISCKKISGEGASCTPELVSPWKETTLPTLLSNYDLKDIYNAEEFGLFYQMHPEKSLDLKNEQCIGGKQSKVRITGMAASNALGDKIPMFVIGKSVKPRCFKGIKKKPCRYRAQKSWMTSDLFEEWVREIDRKFQREDRKIALIVDNCPAHPDTNDLKAIELVFLPQNTTSHTQPMDQGVIWSLKSKYRILSVRRIITALENDEDMSSFSVLDAMKMLVLSWESVTEETIINCFSKAGISKDQQVAAINDDDDPFKALTEEIESLRARKLDLAPEFKSNNLLNVDDGLVCIESLLTDDDIIEQFTRNDDDNECGSDYDKDDEVQVMKPTKTLHSAIDTLMTYTMFDDELGDEICRLASRISALLERGWSTRKRQQSIEQYFKR